MSVCIYVCTKHSCASVCKREESYLTTNVMLPRSPERKALIWELPRSDKSHPGMSMEKLFWLWTDAWAPSPQWDCPRSYETGVLDCVKSHKRMCLWVCKWKSKSEPASRFKLGFSQRKTVTCKGKRNKPFFTKLLWIRVCNDTEHKHTVLIIYL